MAEDSKIYASTMSDDSKQSVYIVMAAFNEGTCIEQVVREIRESYPNVVVVDDGSEDDTFQAACKASKYVLRHAVNRGQGAALQTGIEFALQHRIKVHRVCQRIWFHIL